MTGVRSTTNTTQQNKQKHEQRHWGERSQQRNVKRNMKSDMTHEQHEIETQNSDITTHMSTDTSMINSHNLTSSGWTRPPPPPRPDPPSLHHTRWVCPQQQLHTASTRQAPHSTHTRQTGTHNITPTQQPHRYPTHTCPYQTQGCADTQQSIHHLPRTRPLVRINVHTLSQQRGKGREATLQHAPVTSLTQRCLDQLSAARVRLRRSRHAPKCLHRCNSRKHSGASMCVMSCHGYSWGRHFSQETCVLFIWERRSIQ